MGLGHTHKDMEDLLSKLGKKWKMSTIWLKNGTVATDKHVAKTPFLVFVGRALVA
jgi:hypothetical protein